MYANAMTGCIFPLPGNTAGVAITDPRQSSSSKGLLHGLPTFANLPSAAQRQKLTIDVTFCLDLSATGNVIR
jgi:hypothetical protein